MCWLFTPIFLFSFLVLQVIESAKYNPDAKVNATVGAEHARVHAQLVRIRLDFISFELQSLAALAVSVSSTHSLNTNLSGPRSGFATRFR